MSYLRLTFSLCVLAAAVIGPGSLLPLHAAPAASQISQGDAWRYLPGDPDYALGNDQFIEYGRDGCKMIATRHPGQPVAFRQTRDCR